MLRFGAVRAAAFPLSLRGKSTKTIPIPSHIRARDLAKKFQCDIKYVLHGRVVKDRKKYYVFRTGASYVTDKLSRVIFPYEAVAEMAVKLEKKVTPVEMEPEPWDYSTTGSEEKVPVVSVMGHVDHGKTTLLDRLRGTNVAASEAGGITQRVAAFEYRMPSTEPQLITFLDTPGHAAFFAMRENVIIATDIVLLVVDGAEGIKSQTLEVIKGAKDRDLPVVAAINKIDLVDEARVRSVTRRIKAAVDKDALQAVVPISGLHGTNVPQLCQTLVDTSKSFGLKANPESLPQGTVVEVTLDKRRGANLRLVMHCGVLRRGQHYACGLLSGTIIDLLDHRKEKMECARAGQAVEVMVHVRKSVRGVTSINDCPPLGETFFVLDKDEAERVMDHRNTVREYYEHLSDARVVDRPDGVKGLPKELRDGTTFGDKAAAEGLAEQEEAEEDHASEEKDGTEEEREKEKEKDDSDESTAKASALRPLLREESQDTIGRRITRRPVLVDEGVQSRPCVIKVDHAGSLATFRDVLDQVEDVEVVRWGIGNVSKTDLDHAILAKCDVYCFNVTVPPDVKQRAKDKKIEIRHYNVFHELLAALGVKGHAKK